jgi:hypothetical protein
VWGISALGCLLTLFNHYWKIKLLPPLLLHLCQ